MINKKLSRAIAATAGVGLAVASLVSVAAPAQADAPTTTTFKVHLNVPSEVAAQWNIWSWGGCADPTDNTLGELTKNKGTADAPNNVTMDWTPNFTNDDAYGSYAEFTMPCVVTSLNNVLRTTESWDGQAAADATADAPAKVAIPSADKPLGGDNIFPAGESWWNVNTGLREYPLTRVEYKIHINAPLATLQSQGWNLYSWGTPDATSNPDALAVPLLADSKAYKGKVNKDLTGWPFVGQDSYGAYAIVTAGPDPSGVGLVLRRSGKIGKGAIPGNGWGGPQSGDFKSDNHNNLVAGKSDYWMAVGGNELFTSQPTYVGRYGATATYANGKVTVTPVRPSHASLKGAMPDKIVVTIKKGNVSKSCTITSTALALTAPSWGLGTSCDIAMKQTATDDTWTVWVQGSATGVGAALVGPKESAKITIPKK
jgi:Bacterial pullanase-associated domain